MGEKDKLSEHSDERVISLICRKVDGLETDVRQILIELNNGVRENVKENTRTLKEVKKELNNITKIVEKEETETTTKELIRKALKNRVSWWLAIISTTLLILKYLGII